MGDFESFAQLQSSRLLRLAYLLTGSRPDAEDLAQDALLEIHQRWWRVSRADDVGAYACRVLINRYLSTRRKKTLATVELDSRELASRGPDHADLVANRDVVQRSLMTLPIRQRTALVPRYYEQLETNEISFLMNITESSTRSAISRGLGVLRALLRADQEHTEGTDEPVRDRSGA